MVPSAVAPVEELSGLGPSGHMGWRLGKLFLSPVLVRLLSEVQKTIHSGAAGGSIDCSSKISG